MRSELPQESSGETSPPVPGSPDGGPPPAEAPNPAGARVPPAPARPIPVRGDGARGGGRSGGRGSAGGARGDRRGPRGGRPQASATAPPPPPAEAAARRFTARGGEWIARAAGLGESGKTPGCGAPLVLLTFARADDPERPALEVLHVARGLNDLGEDALTDLLERSRPYGGTGQRADLFSETRHRKKGER